MGVGGCLSQNPRGDRPASSCSHHPGEEMMTSDLCEPPLGLQLSDWAGGSEDPG